MGQTMSGYRKKSALTAVFAAVSALYRQSPARALRRIAILPFLLLMTGLAACGGGPIGGSAEAMRQSSAAAQSYRLAPGDKVHITVFNEANLSGDYVVGPDGRVTLPLAGGLQAAGLSLPQFQTAVAQLLKNGFVQDPNVTITASDLRPYYILGEVKKPGRYNYMPDLTVLNAVATAEGFTYRANTGAIYIRRAAEPSEKEIELTATTAVMPGDTIRIAQRYF
jgi:protein involved in polysaccharide export with SLBB domain